MTRRSLGLVGLPRAAVAMATVAGVCAFGLLLEGTTARLLGQTFRASVDLIAVDVQVVDRGGRPVTTLGPESFEVTLDGRKRKVVSATFTKYDITPMPADPRAIPDVPDAPVPGAPLIAGRTFIIAIDTASFRSLDVRVATLAAERFTRQLLPQDEVGVFTLPYGPKLTPTTSHATARQLIGTVMGRKPSSGLIEMSVEQVIDITSAMATQTQLQSRATVTKMMTDDSGPGDASDSALCSITSSACTEQALSEAQSLATSFEQDMLQGLAGLDSLLRELQQSPGRKTVILLSGGMPVSDRSGGRPALADEVKRLGEQATYANATINTIYFDPSATGSFSVNSRKPKLSTGRSLGIYTRALNEFSEPSGGILLQASSGAGEREIDRILNEISTYYVLGVEPDDRDRDGRPHQLKVKVAQRDVNIRNRHLVIVPKPGK
jgi:VWFA-related protein